MSKVRNEFRTPARIAADEEIASAAERGLPLPGVWEDVLPADGVNVSLSPLPLPGKRNLFREKIEHEGVSYSVRCISFTDAVVTVELEPSNVEFAIVLAREIGDFAEALIPASHLSRDRVRGTAAFPAVQEKA